MFAPKSEVNMSFDLKQLTKLLYSQEFDYIDGFIRSVELMNVINHENVPELNETEHMKEFYVIKIKLEHPGVPLEFLKRLDCVIDIPVIYQLEYSIDFVDIHKGWAVDYTMQDYIFPLKNEKKEMMRVFDSGWLIGLENENIESLNITNDCKTIEDLYVKYFCLMTGVEIKNDSLLQTIEFYKRTDFDDSEDDYLNRGYASFDSFKERFVDLYFPKVIDKAISKIIKKYISANFDYYKLKESYVKLFKIDHKQYSYIKTKNSDDHIVHNDFIIDYDDSDNPIYEERPKEEQDTMKCVYGKYLGFYIENNIKELNYRGIIISKKNVRNKKIEVRFLTHEEIQAEEKKILKKKELEKVQKSYNQWRKNV